MAFNKVKQIVVEEDFRHPESESGLHFGPSLFLQEVVTVLPKLHVVSVSFP